MLSVDTKNAEQKLHSPLIHPSFFIHPGVNH